MRNLVSSIGIVALICATQAVAETPSPYPSFTFKRVGLPEKGSTNRITVQVDPSVKFNHIEPEPKSEETKPEKAAAKAEAGKAPVISELDWYWAGVSPKLEDSGPGRLQTAVGFLDMGPNGQTVPTPRLQQMDKIAKAYGTEILKATVGTRVSPALVLAVIRIESAGKSAAVSGAGATGLMQLMPATAKRFGVEDSTIAAQNIKGGVAYLNWLMKKFDNDPVLVLAGYNAGENAVTKYGGVPPYAETRAYVPKVLAAWTVARRLCLTPPELVTDGCVFGIRGLASNE